MSQPSVVEDLVRRLTRGERLPDLSKDERHTVLLLARAAKAGVLRFGTAPRRGGLSVTPEIRHSPTPE